MKDLLPRPESKLSISNAPITISAAYFSFEMERFRKSSPVEAPEQIEAVGEYHGFVQSDFQID